MEQNITLRKDSVHRVVATEAEAKELEKSGWKRITPEQQLEAETGHDVVQTGDNPPTYVETDDRATDAPEVFS